ncbi:MAG: NADH-quinone oxidoreductase subunit, partial [Humisphaera sp.]|nr:NADH-quinone oxidoreductase subunit [Humisphaera sp.]
MENALLLLVLIPAIGAVIGAALPARSLIVRWWALGASLLTAFVALLVAMRFEWSAGGEINTSLPAFYLESVGFGFKFGADAISLWLVLLSVFLTPLAILASFKSITDRPKEYYAWMLLLLAAMNGVFLARDLLLFYIFFELTLIPMFFIIGIWGGPERRYAAGKFFLFTFTGSVFLLVGIIYLGMNNPISGQSGGFDLATAVTYAQTQLSPDARWWLLLAFLAGFAVKVPLFPVHTWLPLAHTEAPTAGSVILAGVLLKLGTYGLLRLAVPIASPDAVVTLTPWIGWLCVIGIIYGALVAWVQRDVKKLVAYSSVSHLGFCVLGLFALNTMGVQGSVLYMINHGLSTGALFLCVGMFYDRYHTRDINELSGLAKVMPIWAFFMVLFSLSSIGLPGLNGFVSEFLTILAAFTSDRLGIAYGVFAATGIVLGAVYMLHMLARIVWGPLKTPGGHTDDHGHTAHGVAVGQENRGQGAAPESDLPTDLSGREIGILV